MNIFSFWRKKDQYDEIYPSFTMRMFASVIDVTLATFVLIPIVYWLFPVFYGGALPSQKFSEIMIKVHEQARNLNFLQVLERSHIEFVRTYGYTGLIVEKVLQLSILASITFIFWLKTHSTPGKLLLSMKIVDEKTMGPPSAKQLFIRILAYAVSVIPCCIGIFYIYFNKKHRAWHDIIAGTVVIYHKKFFKLKK